MLTDEPNYDYNRTSDWKNIQTIFHNYAMILHLTVKKINDKQLK